MRVSSFRALCLPLLCVWVLSSGLGQLLSDHVLAEHELNSNPAVHGAATPIDFHGADEDSDHEHQIASAETPALGSHEAQALLLRCPPFVTPAEWALDPASFLLACVRNSRLRAGPSSFQLATVLRI